MATILSRKGSTPTLLLVFFLSLIIRFTEARDFVVGGKQNAWRVPSSETDSLNHWAQKSRFQIGDSLVWEYYESQDSVLRVSKRDYLTCNTSSPIETYTGGQTKLKLEESGPYYFISGAQGHCAKGQKLIVVVMSEKHRRRHMAPAPAPVVEVEAPAPTNGGRMLRSSTGGGVLEMVFVALFFVVML